MNIACVAGVSESKTARKMAQVKEHFFSFFGFHFISRAAKTGLSLIRNQMETLATQANVNSNLLLSMALSRRVGGGVGVEQVNDQL